LLFSDLSSNIFSRLWTICLAISTNCSCVHFITP